MRVGVVLGVGAVDETLPARQLADAAVMAEQAGVASIWVFDAIGRGVMLPDPLMALTAAAMVTERVELGTGVLQLPIRNEAEVAHRILTLHRLAGNRLLVGVGCGSTRSDFEAFGADFAGRHGRFGTQVDALRDALRTGNVNGVDLAPGHDHGTGPPVLIGSWAGTWVERAAADHEGWIASAAKTEGGDDAVVAALGRYRAKGGTRAVVTNIRAGRDLGPTLERLDRFAEAGFDDAVVFDPRLTGERAATVAAGGEQP
jgi:alkanesulfonate monooxygenase SsuD/methylene tetrahydromethanopterin reductase-like flavin-dependent oxidoreductase (luciferase family)